MGSYLVDAICGHVGRGYGIRKCFPIKANSASEAASICRNKPRVKHDLKFAILNVREVSSERYEYQIKINESDPFFIAKSRRESYLLGMDYDSVFSMEIFFSDYKRKKDPYADGRKSVHGISKKKYVNHYKDHFEEDYYETIQAM